MGVQKGRRATSGVVVFGNEGSGDDDTQLDSDVTHPSGVNHRRRTARKLPRERLADGEIDITQATDLARESALRSLTASAKSRSDLRLSLLQKGHADAVVEPLLDRLQEVGLLSDEAYAASLVRSRRNARGHSRRALANELRRRGIAEEIIQNVLADISDAAETDMAREFAAKFAHRTSGLPDDIRLRRIVAALGRRGYSANQAHQIASDVIAEFAYRNENITA